MKFVIGVSCFIAGAVMVYLLVSLGVLDGIPGIQVAPASALPVYLNFVSVMMTTVTVILAVLAFGIAVVAAFTFRGIKEEVLRVARAQIDEKLSDVAIRRRVNEVALQQTATHSQDPDEQEN